MSTMFGSGKKKRVRFRHGKCFFPSTRSWKFMKGWLHVSFPVCFVCRGSRGTRINSRTVTPSRTPPSISRFWSYQGGIKASFGRGSVQFHLELLAKAIASRKKKGFASMWIHSFIHSFARFVFAEFEFPSAHFPHSPHPTIPCPPPHAHKWK